MYFNVRYSDILVNMQEFTGGQLHINNRILMAVFQCQAGSDFKIKIDHWNSNLSSIISKVGGKTQTAQMYY